ncbi:MAG TPA: hypothetical protein VKD65_03940, partial [Candidatus Angelobacter sp.]|nr:hypothetical protein [Candidatus Angelobacter sp.]
MQAAYIPTPPVALSNEFEGFVACSRQNNSAGKASPLKRQPNGCIIASVDADMDKVFKALADP